MSYLGPETQHRTKLVWFGILLPIITLSVELATSLSADTFADPIPDLLRFSLVLLVPGAAATLLVLQRRGVHMGAGASGLAGMALGVAAIHSLLYLPLLPLAIPGLLVGVGILPLAPLASLVALSMYLRPLWRRAALRPRWIWVGGAASVALLLAADLPAALARLAIDRQGMGDSEGAMRLVRLGASHNWIVEAAHGRRVAFSGLPTMLTEWSVEGARWEMPRPARELLFLITGEGLEALPLRASRGLLGRHYAQWQVDRDLAGEVVGGKAKGLTLVVSRMDMEALPQANAAYVEWTAEVANSSRQQQEARLTLALPEGAVASRATLWVHGEAREASVATRSQARAAYESVVERRRDPLLVTTDGSGRLLVQAFPIEPGERMKFRIGVSAPMQVAADGSRSVGLPAIVNHNFAIPAGFRHDVQVEGASGTRGLPLVIRNGKSGPVLAGRVSDTILLQRTGRATAFPLNGPMLATGRLGDLRVRQQVVLTNASSAAPLMLLVDGSRSNRKAAEALAASLDSLAPGFPVGLTIAGAQVTVVPPAPWSRTQKARFLRLLSAQPFEGGHDNVPGLLAALDTAGTILWIHGVQPVRFAATTSELETAIERARGNLPRIVRFQHVAGQAFGLVGQRWLDTARDVAPSEDQSLGLGALLRELSGADPYWAVSREPIATGSAPGDVRGGDQIVRLWAAGKAGNIRGRSREAASRQAAKLGLIASDTGAVVLETDQETTERGLPAAPSNIPAVPEPATWMMLISGFYLLGWHIRRQRAHLTCGASQ